MIEAELPWGSALLTASVHGDHLMMRYLINLCCSVWLVSLSPTCLTAAPVPPPKENKTYFLVDDGVVTHKLTIGPDGEALDVRRVVASPLRERSLQWEGTWRRHDTNRLTIAIRSRELQFALKGGKWQHDRMCQQDPREIRTMWIMTPSQLEAFRNPNSRNPSILITDEATRRLRAARKAGSR